MLTALHLQSLLRQLSLLCNFYKLKRVTKVTRFLYSAYLLQLQSQSFLIPLVYTFLCFRFDCILSNASPKQNDTSDKSREKSSLHLARFRKLVYTEYTTLAQPHNLLRAFSSRLDIPFNFNISARNMNDLNHCVNYRLLILIRGFFPRVNVI